MADLNVMLLEHARAGLQTQLDAAVTNGDTEAARKVTTELEKLAASNAPKAPPYTPDDVQAELAKLDWYGTDPKKSARTVELGKSMSLKKFATAAEFAAALVKAVDEEFKPVGKAPGAEDEEENEEDEGDGEGGAPAPKPKPKQRASDAPNDNDAGGVRSRRTSGPWLKMSDAPADIQKEVTRTADKFAPKTKEGREKYVVKALEAQYNAHQTRAKAGKK